MRLIEQEKWIRIRLDLRDWWEKVEDANEAQNKLVEWDHGPFWWYDEGRKHIITLKNWRMTPYNLTDTILVLPAAIDKKLWAIRKTAADLHIILRLDMNNKVKNREEAEERYENWENEVFWLVTPDRKTLVTLDFSKGWKPLMTEYPRDKTSVRYRAVV